MCTKMGMKKIKMMRMRKKMHTHTHTHRSLCNIIGFLSFFPCTIHPTFVFSCFTLAFCKYYCIKCKVFTNNDFKRNVHVFHWNWIKQQKKKSCIKYDVYKQGMNELHTKMNRLSYFQQQCCAMYNQCLNINSYYEYIYIPIVK